jgi:beta-lactamase class A
VRTASTIKLPILCGLAAEVAAGRARWDEPVTYRAQDRVSGSGVLQEFTPGTALSLRDLAALMIVVSDNTATNLVLDRIGADRVNDALDTLGFTSTRSLRKIRGDGTQLKEAEGWSRAGLARRTRASASACRRRGRWCGCSTCWSTAPSSAPRPRATSCTCSIASSTRTASAGARRRSAWPARAARSMPSAATSASSTRPAGRLAMAITVDDMPEVDYSPDNPGNKLIWEISRTLIEALGSP